MKFDWRDFTEEDFADYCAEVKRVGVGGASTLADTVFGAVHVGELCFDLVLREYAEGTLTLTYDCYIGGMDTGYGYSPRVAVESGKYESKELVPLEDLYPYDEYDTGCFKSNDTCIMFIYDAFVEFAEATFRAFILQHYEDKLVQKANKPLVIF